MSLMARANATPAATSTRAAAISPAVFWSSVCERSISCCAASRERCSRNATLVRMRSLNVISAGPFIEVILVSGEDATMTPRQFSGATREQTQRQRPTTLVLRAI